MAFNRHMTPRELLDTCRQALATDIEELPDGTAMMVMGDGLGLYDYYMLPDIGRADILERKILTMKCPACGEEGKGVLAILDHQVDGKQVESFACTGCEQFVNYTR